MSLSSRAMILDAAAKNQPAERDLPSIDFEKLVRFEDLATAFEQAVQKIGGKVVHLPTLAEAAGLWDLNDKFSISTLNCSPAFKEELLGLRARDLAHLDTLYLKGGFGVAENGAVWVDEEAMVNRLLPFICQHLVIVLPAEQIVPTMHHAYQRTEVSGTGFGSFIAGPSKTADIEQSLVIGAHGPRSLTVCLVQE